MLKDKGFFDKDIKCMGIVLVLLRVFINFEFRIIDFMLLVFCEVCLSVEGFLVVVFWVKEIEIIVLDREVWFVMWRIFGWLVRIV